MTVGERIKKLRTQKKLTQTELAGPVQLSYILFGRYETNKPPPPADMLQRLAAPDITTD